MKALVKILLVALATVAFTSCIVRRNPNHNWYKKHPRNFHYHKGNDYGGRRLWVRYPYRQL